MHGYQLNERVTHAMSMYTDLKKSTTYYALEKLEKNGCVQYEVEREGKRPERRVYEITAKGRECFLDLLRQNLRTFTRTYYVDDVGVAFIDKLSTTEARELLVEKRRKAEAMLKQFREVPEHGKKWRYMVEHNIAHLEADLNWLDNVLCELDDI